MRVSRMYQSNRSAGNSYSDAVVIGQICHIYAAADNGPAWQPNLSDAERNAPENLILMCGHHHPIVDKQWETYPADLLKQWKKDHEAKYQQGTAEAIKLQASMQQVAFLQNYSDRQIEAEIEKIRQGRYINSYPTRMKATELASRIEQAELAGGSSETRAKGLAWCCTAAKPTESLDRARGLLRSQNPAITSEAVFAEAFILANDNKARALALVRPVNTPAARSVACAHRDQQRKSGGSRCLGRKGRSHADSFDPKESSFTFINELAMEKWQRRSSTPAENRRKTSTTHPSFCTPVAMSFSCRWSRLNCAPWS